MTDRSSSTRTDKTLLGSWIRRFLLEHAIDERNFARNTQLSYRDTLTLLLPFISTARKMPVDRLTERLPPQRYRRSTETVTLGSNSAADRRASHFGRL